MANTFKEFHQTTGAYLILGPHANMFIADFADKAKKSMLDVEDENILDELNLPNQDYKKYKKYVENVPKIAANLAEISIDKSTALDIDIKLPTQKIDPSLKLDKSKIVNFSYDNVKAKVLDNSNLDFPVRKFIEDILESLSRKENRDLRKDIGNLKRTCIIERLYYADSVKLEMKKEFKLDPSLEANLGKVGDISLTPKVETNGNTTYTFTGNAAVPFAATIVALKDL